MESINKNESYKSESENLPVEIKFYTETATAILNIDKNAVDLESKKNDAKQHDLSKKDEFHITIIGSDTGEEILKSLELLAEDEKDKILDQICELFELFEWNVTLKQEFYFLEKSYDNSSDSTNLQKEKPEKRKSIIQIAEIDKIDKFYEKLNRLLGKQFETPFPHVTLYTTSTLEEKKLRGVGIYSKNQFEELNPEKI
ncbi:MAG: hypothetical protein Q8P57_04965 [Candidatus Pacearchaeota archaeon]|nr:hypothetical protein [Candidatus Pacearchaeota archaeon]